MLVQGKYKVLFIIIIGNFSTKVFLDVLHTNNIFYSFLQYSVMFIFLYLNLYLSIPNLLPLIFTIIYFSLPLSVSN